MTDNSNSVDSFLEMSTEASIEEDTIVMLDRNQSHVCILQGTPALASWRMMLCTATLTQTSSISIKTISKSTQKQTQHVYKRHEIKHNISTASGIKEPEE